MKTGITTVGEIALDICLAPPAHTSHFCNYTTRAGGAALSTAAICASLEMKSVCVGKTGKDPFGTLLTQLTHNTQARTTCIYSHRSSTCFTIHDPYGKLTLAGGDANRLLTSKDIIPPLANTVPRSKYLYLGGASSLIRLHPHLHSLLRYAARQGTVPVIDPGIITTDSSEQSCLYIRSALAQAELCICRKDSFCALWNTRTIDEAFAKLRTVSACTVALYDSSTGAQGLQMLTKVTIPPLQHTTDMHSFDAFAAGILKAIDRGLPFRDVLKVGCAVAYASALHQSLPTLDEVQHIYNSRYAHITL